MPIWRRIASAWKNMENTGQAPVTPSQSAAATAVVIASPVSQSQTDPNVVAGALTVGNASYPIPVGALFVNSSGGSDSNAGTQTAPFATYEKATQVVTTGGTIVLRGAPATARGTHPGYHEGRRGTGTTVYTGITVTDTNVTVQNYPNEEVWFDGSVVVTGWTTDTTTVPGKTLYKVTFAFAFDRSPTYSQGADESLAVGFQFVNPAWPTAAWPMMVFLDGEPMLQVNAVASVDAGEFYIAGTYTGGTSTPTVAGQTKYLFTSTTVYIGTNPAGHTMRITDYQTAIGLGASGCKVRGIGIRRYGSSNAQLGTAKSYRDNCIWENVVIQDPGVNGISTQTGANQLLTNCTVDRAGGLNVHSNNADSLTHYRLRSTRANATHFNYAPSEGCVKVTRQRNYLAQDCVMSDSFGKGFWADESVDGVVLVNCNIQNNEQRGIVIELCAGMIVANCLITGNGADGLVPYNTTGIRVWNTTLANNGRLRNVITSNTNPRQIAVYADGRAPRDGSSVGLDTRYGFPGPYPYMTWELTSIEVVNCVNDGGNLQALLGVEDYRKNESAARSWTTMGVDYRTNAYGRASTALPAWTHIIPLAGAANPSVYTSLTSFRSATSEETGSVILDAGSYLNADFSLKSLYAATLHAGATVLPTDIADLTGQSTGDQHMGCWR